MGGVGKFFKDAGNTIKQGSKSVGHVFSEGGKKIEGAVSDVYHDGRSAVSYTGKHLINDVDQISSALSSPMVWVVGGVLIILVLNQNK